MISAAGLTLGAAAPAMAGSAPGWRVDYTHHYGAAAAASGFTTATAISKTDAWELGVSWPTSGSSTGVPVAAHWNGTSWSPVVMPDVATGFLSASGDSCGQVWAISATDGYVFHYVAGHWTVARHMPGKSVFTGVTDIGTRNVWVFGGNLLEGIIHGFGTWHYNGASWTQWKGNAVGLDFASALSATDIWAIGGPQAPQAAIENFNGTAWSPVSSPALSGLFFSGIAALSVKNVWASAVVTSNGTDTLVHYNGSAWSRVAIPGPVITIFDLASDGQGGLWLTGQDVHFASYVLHRNRAGAWTRVHTSSAVFKLATIPGTTSMWGTGQQHNNAAVWAYGQIP